MSKKHAYLVTLFFLKSFRPGFFHQTRARIKILTLYFTNETKLWVAQPVVTRIFKFEFSWKFWPLRTSLVFKFVIIFVKKRANLVTLFFLKVHIFWEGHSSPYFWLALHRTKVRWWFHKILWPSQNISLKVLDPFFPSN